jgi:uncharacterized small protein (DUF1192 family)
MSLDARIAANQKRITELRAELNRIRVERIPPKP